MRLLQSGAAQWRASCCFEYDSAPRCSLTVITSAAYGKHRRIGLFTFQINPLKPSIFLDSLPPCRRAFYAETELKSSSLPMEYPVTGNFGKFREVLFTASKRMPCVQVEGDFVPIFLVACNFQSKIGWFPAIALQSTLRCAQSNAFFTKSVPGQNLLHSTCVRLRRRGRWRSPRSRTRCRQY